MIDSVLLNAVAVWFVYYALAYAGITRSLRGALKPISPKWVVTLFSCPVCASFWPVTAFSIFTGYYPFIFWVPPTVLFIDLAYHRLSGGGEKGSQ